MVAAAIIGGVATAAIGGAVTSSAVNSASKTAAETADKNNALQSQIYGENSGNLQPFVTSGQTATKSIDALLGQSGDPTAANTAFQDYENSTEYQNRLTQGQNSLTASLGAKGLLDSGAAQKALLSYGQTAASGEFQTYLGNLQGQEQTGLGAASSLAGIGQSYANAVSANNNTAANASENAALLGANNVNGLLNGAVSAYGFSQGLGSSYGGKPTSSGTQPVYGGLLGGIY